MVSGLAVVDVVVVSGPGVEIVVVSGAAVEVVTVLVEGVVGGVLESGIGWIGSAPWIAPVKSVATIKIVTSKHCLAIAMIVKRMS